MTDPLLQLDHVGHIVAVIKDFDGLFGGVAAIAAGAIAARPVWHQVKQSINNQKVSNISVLEGQKNSIVSTSSFLMVDFDRTMSSIRNSIDHIPPYGQFNIDRFSRCLESSLNFVKENTPILILSGHKNLRDEIISDLEYMLDCAVDMAALSISRDKFDRIQALINEEMADEHQAELNAQEYQQTLGDDTCEERRDVWYEYEEAFFGSDSTKFQEKINNKTYEYVRLFETYHSYKSEGTRLFHENVGAILQKTIDISNKTRNTIDENTNKICQIITQIAQIINEQEKISGRR